MRLLYLKWIANEDLMYSTWDSVQCYVAAWMGEGFGREWIHVCIYIYVWLNPFATSYTPIQSKKFLKKGNVLCTSWGYTPSSLIISSFLAPALSAPWLMSQAVMVSGPRWGFNHTRRLMLCCRPLAWVASTLSRVYGALPSWQVSPVPEAFSGTAAQGRLQAWEEPVWDV